MKEKYDSNYTIEDLKDLKRQSDSEIDRSRSDILKLWVSLTTPPSSDGKVQNWVNQVERAVALYDGVMTGYKLLRRFGSVVRRITPKKTKRGK